MDQIFDGAFATIIALSGDDANSGLPRVGSRSNSISQAVADFGNENQLLSRMPTLKQQLQRSIWSQRAWTFQEGILSRRCLFFTHHQVYFGCNKTGYCESVNGIATTERTLHYESSPEAYDENFDSFSVLLRNPFTKTSSNSSPYGSEKLYDKDVKPMSLTPTYEKYELYDQIIGRYVAKELSYDLDSLNTVSGLLKCLETHIFYEEMYFGLPVADFRHSLSWKQEVMFPHEHEMRQRARRRVCFPSWSWAGWDLKGSIRTRDEIYWWPTIPRPPLRIWTPDGRCLEPHDSPARRPYMSYPGNIVPERQLLDGLYTISGPEL